MSASASILSDFWQDQLVDHHRQALFLVLVAFLASFAFIRVSARLGRSPRFAWWPGSVVSESGVHLHHLVWGIGLMLVAGPLGFATYYVSPWREVCAVLFGIGAGFTVDEFALWVYLKDVYWAREGRSSIDAAIVAAAGMLLVLLGGRPFGVGSGSVAQLVFSLGVAALVLVVVAACFAKHRVLHGAIGCFLWPLAIYGAVRLGKPESLWARRFYGDRNPRKQARAQARFPPDRRSARFMERVRDAIGGETDERYQAKVAERLAAAEAAEEVRRRADRAAAAKLDAPP